jgi:hypothetical protein
MSASAIAGLDSIVLKPTSEVALIKWVTPVPLAVTPKPTEDGPLYRFMILTMFRKNDPCQEKYLKIKQKRVQTKKLKEYTLPKKETSKTPPLGFIYFSSLRSPISGKL